MYSIKIIKYNYKIIQCNFQGSKHKLVYDGMWHFDIPKCRDIDAGKVEVIARNSCGEAYSSTTLKVNPRQDDYRNVLKHNVKRKSPYSPRLLLLAKFVFETAFSATKSEYLALKSYYIWWKMHMRFDNSSIHNPLAN